MSAKVGVLESHQNPTESPSRRVKKAIALYLVRKALAEWVSKAAIRLRPAHEFVAAAKSMQIVQRAPQFDYDYPEHLFRNLPKRTFWREALLLTYPLQDQRS